MTDNQRGDIHPAWSPEQIEEMNRRAALRSKKERIERAATAILAGIATSGFRNGSNVFSQSEAARAAWYLAVDLINGVDDIK